MPRIISTCVGKSFSNCTCAAASTGCERSDHPHVREEKILKPTKPTWLNGSSPRAWGKVDVILRDHPAPRIIPTCVGKRASNGWRAGRGRIIPTCVGKSPDLPEFHFPVSDHPHVRGEKAAIMGQFGRIFGSSPRAWGKDRLRPLGKVFFRIIPTRVGKRLLPFAPVPRNSDHPHACGEKVTPHLPPAFFIGSSPRVWGKAAWA